MNHSSLGRFAGLQNFLVIWAGQLISAVGSRLSSFALGIWVLRTTGSTTHFALILLASTIPALVVSMVAGALVDRWDRRKTMLACDSVSATTMFVTAALGASGHLTIWQIYLAVGADEGLKAWLTQLLTLRAGFFFLWPEKFFAFWVVPSPT